MKYAIKRNNNIIAQVEPQGNVSTKIMGEELVNMTFELPTMVKFQIGDSVNVYGANYYLLQAPVVEKVNTRHFKYSLQFGSIIYELSKIQLLFPDAENNLTVSDGNPIGNADLLIGHVLNNANRLQNGWTKGTVIETEAKQVDFSEDNCLSALAKIAEAFEVEYWIDANKSIHIVERKNDSGYSFQYGKNKGLKSITRNPMDGSNIVTRLYAVGSEKNIGAKYRNGAKRLKMDVPYLEKNTDIYNVIEHTKKFDEVYPKRIGTVTAVDANNPLIFTDSTMDFDLNERDGNGTTILIQGVPAKVTFQTGQLAGYMLEIKENGYHTATKTFTLNKNKDEKAIEVPSSLMRPKVGDKYIITDIVMPASYVTNAEAELKVKAQEYLDKNCKERLQYTVVSDPFFFRELNVNIALGNTVHFIDADLGLDANLRILSISKDLQNPYKVSFEIGEDATIISIVRAYIEKEKQQTAIIKEQKYNAAAARAAYYFGLELSEKTFDSEGYFDVTKIKPASIDTKLISLGGRMQQFSLPDVNFYLENNYTSLRNTSGRIVHLTIGDTPRTWYIASNTILNIGAVYQYVYVKCQRNGTNANILVTPNQITVEQDPDFFHFEAGYISSIQNGFRVCKMTYGFAQINPQEISIGRWTSPLGGDYIAFNESGIEIKGKVTFASDSPALNQVQEKIDAVQIGGRNTYKKSTPIDTLNVDFQREHADAPNGFYAVGRNNPDVNNIRLWGVIDGNGDWTVSWEMRGTQSVVIGLEVDICDNGLQYFSSTPDNSWKKYSLTVNVTNHSADVYNFVDFSKFQWAYYLIRNIKIEKGNKATDWTPAPEDIQEQLNNAQNSANAANQKLADIANDNVLTASEKPDVIKEWQVIDAEFPHIRSQAITFSVNYDNFSYFYLQLSNYLISIEYANLTKDNPINGVEFRQKFVSYYTERTDLLKRISDASKSYSKELVDNIKIGGENLVDFSNNPVIEKPDYIASANVSIESNNPVTDGFLVHTLGNAGSGWMQFDIQSLWNSGLVKGKTYTISLETWSLQPLRIGIDGENFGNPLENPAIPASKEWKRIYRTFVYAQNSPPSPHYLIYFDGAQGTNYALRNLKLEEGTMATPWSRSQADIDRHVQSAQNAANTANQKLSDIASDNKFTPSEKQDTLKEWTVIVNEVPIIMDQAATYGVSSANYEGHYVNLSNYITNNGLLNDLNSTSDIDGATFRLYFKNYYAAKVDLLRNISTASKNYTNSTTEAAKTEMAKDARNKALAASYASGNCLNRDVDFRNGLNGIQVYNNAGNGTVSLVHWIGGAPASQAPTKSTNVLAVEYNGQGASPYNGGFYFGTQTRVNAVFVVRIIMKLAVGQEISFHSNATGDNSKFDWVTPVIGTGKWEEYIGVLRCGTTGVFSSSMFFAFAGASVPLSTYICYASVFDLTDVDKYLEDKIKQNEQQTAIAKAQADNALNTANRVSQLTSFMNTTVDGNVVASGTMLVGDVNGGNAGMTGVTDRGSDSVRFFLGTNYANKNKAPLAFIDKGLIQMHHPNGVLGFELGIVDGKLVFNVYDDIGSKIMEMGSQGIIFSNYIPDSWTNLKLAKFDSANYSPYDATSVTNFANTNTRQIMVNNPGGIEDAQHWNINVPKTEASHINYSTYSAGRSYDSNTYVIYEGIYFEGTLQKPQKPNGSIAKLADGWYYNIVFLSVWKKYGDPYQTGAYSYTFQLFRLSAGKVVETKDYTINGQV